MTEELERTFILRYLPPMEGCRQVLIEDIYIPASARHPVIRIRRAGQRLEFTKKSPKEGDSSEQVEHTVPLTEEEFGCLASLEGKRLSKTRYFLDSGAEIDIFHGPLEGLCLADFEFRTSEEKSSFTPPKFCLAEVTQEEAIAGGMLAGKSYQDIEGMLEGLGYSRISPQTPSVRG